MGSRRITAAFTALLMLGAGWAHAEQIPEDTEFNELLSMDLADLTVTSVAKRPQRLEDTAAAVYVITQEDLKRTGVRSIADALRMAPGVEVAQINAHSWAISVRGFNGTLNNKLLVMIDGRSIYTPVYGGTYWDDRFLPIEEVDRIEIIRGPGGSTWGDNATNGVINILTKHTADTQGTTVTEAIGTGQMDDSIVQHGGRINADTTYRVYGSYINRGDTTNAVNGGHEFDSFDRGIGGFRVDRDTHDGDSYLLTGNVYGGETDERETLPMRDPLYSTTSLNDDHSYGESVLGRWDHQFGPQESGTLQAFADHYDRLEEIAGQHISTFDLDWQHNAQTSARNHFSWGLGARDTQSDIDGSFEVRVGSEQHQEFDLFSAFVQDDYALVTDKLILTLGSKFEHNDFTGFEMQPTARLSWHIDNDQTAWTAVTRSVRTPSIIEEEITAIFAVGPGAGGIPNYYELLGSPNLKTERVTSYEVGYRFKPTPKVDVDTTAYLNRYSNLVTITAESEFDSMSGLTHVFPFVAQNGGEGYGYGAEMSGTYRVTPSWKLMGTATFGQLDLSADPGSSTNFDPTQEDLPKFQLSARSYWNVTSSLQWDNMLYYVDGIQAPVSAYVRYDTHLGWHVMPDVELSLIGQNLLEPHHMEFPTAPRSEIDRAFIGQVAVKF